MTTSDQRRLRRRFVTITALTWLPQGTGMAAMLLLMTARGLDLATIGVVVVVQSVTVTAFELPTGGMSDVLGRRGVLAVSAVVGLTACAWTAVGTHLWEFVALAVLRGIARALSTGPAEAWYVDSARAADPGADIRRGLAYGHTAESIGLGAGTLIGGALPTLVPLPSQGILIGLSTPMLLSALFYAALLIVALTGMSEPPRSAPRPSIHKTLSDVPRTIRDGLGLAVRHRALTALLGTFVIAGIALTSVEMLTPGRLAALTGDPDTAAMAYGVVTAIGFVGSGLGALASPPIAGRLGGRAARAGMLGVGVCAVGLLCLFATSGLAGVWGLVTAAAGYGIMFCGLGIAGPVTSELIHGEVSSTERATVVSIQSLLQQGGGVAGSLLLPWIVAGWSVGTAWLISGLLTVGAMLLYLLVRPAARREPVPSALELS